MEDSTKLKEELKILEAELADAEECGLELEYRLDMVLAIEDLRKKIRAFNKPQ